MKQSGEVTDNMRIYYSHAMVTYGTITEKTEKRRIKARFMHYKIIDPGTYEDNAEKRRKGMNYCLQLIDDCDALIFSRCMNSITAGVGKEVNYALSKGIPVYELSGKRVESVCKRVAYLPRVKTRELYRAVKVQ